MVSIGQSLSELDKAHRAQEAMVDSFRASILTLAQYVVEVDPELATAHRAHLTDLAGSIKLSASPAEVNDHRASLRNELRDYRDRAAKHMQDLHEELSAKADSLHQLFEAMTAGDGDHEERMTRTLSRLRELADDPRSGPLRASLLTAAENLAQSLDELKRQNQLTVAQFLMEIQVLHNRIESLQTAVSVDASTQLASRQQFESHVRTAFSMGTPFSLLLLRTRNLASIQRQFGDVVLENLLSAFAKRLRTCLRAEDPAGRWGEDRFAVVLEGANSTARAKAKAVAEHCSGTYVCMIDGKPMRPVLQTDVGVVDSSSGDSAERLIQRAEEFFRACT
jgi:diguanylate cyclase (GGDEF)-like protein